MTETAENLSKRKDLWGGRKLGGTSCSGQKATEHKDRPQNQDGFATETAKATGMANDPLEQFRQTLEQALFAAELHTELIRLRPLLRRALNICNDQLENRNENSIHSTLPGDL